MEGLLARFTKNLTKYTLSGRGRTPAVCLLRPLVPATGRAAVPRNEQALTVGSSEGEAVAPHRSTKSKHAEFSLSRAMPARQL